MDLTTVSEDEAVVHDGLDIRTYDGLDADTLYEFDGFVFRTLARPPGELLCRFATVNDVHFGEVACGMVDWAPEVGPTFSTPEGAEPYPEMMNRHVVAEMDAIDPAAVVVKGDLTSNGTDDEYQQFCDFYAPVFGDRLHHIRGNHESYHHQHVGDATPAAIDLPGVTLALIDTSIDGKATGGVDGDTLVWLRDTAADAARAQPGLPMLVFGHHHCWSPESHERPDDYFGIDPNDSERLVEVVAAHPNIAGYFAGHTHRNRVRRFTATRDVPWVEVASVKEFPGMWAEYRVYEGGVTQIGRRIAHPEAMQWSTQTRAMYSGLFSDYAFGSLSDRCYVVTSS